MKNRYITVERAVEDLKQGKMIIVQDAANRENEADIVFFASKCDISKIRFTTNIARGLLCVALSPEKADKLGLSLVVKNNDSAHNTPFATSIDAKIGTTTGISIRDRAITISKIGERDSSSEDFYKPGHIFPLIAKKNGLKEREGHTEAAVNLAKIAVEEEAVAICEILGSGDDMISGDELDIFAEKYDLGILTIESLIRYSKSPQLLKTLPTPYGIFSMYAFEKQGEPPLLALVSGELENLSNPLVRMHSECLTGDLLSSLRCDCGEQKKRSLEKIGEEGGIFIYLRQEGRGIGLIEKMKAYNLQDDGFDTIEANLALGHKVDERDYKDAIDVFKFLNIDSVRLLTNNPKKVEALVNAGISVTREPIIVNPGTYNHLYLETKKDKMSHLLTVEE